MVATHPRRDDLARAGALLLAGRQLGAAVFLVAVLFLPRLAAPAIVEGFIWSNFIVLFVSSVLNLGLERATAIVIGGHQAQRPGGGGAFRSLLTTRLLSLPATLIAVVLIDVVARAELSTVTLLWTAAWTAAVQVQGIAFAAHRALALRAHEPVAAVTGRLVQASLLVTLAHAGTDLATMVGAVALVDVLVAVLAVRSIRGPSGAAAGDWRASLDWADLRIFTLLELVAFVYLRVDALLIARLVDSSAGATYNLMYRIVDAATGLATPFILVLFPAAAGLVASGVGVSAMRRRASRTAPAAGVVVAVAVLLLSVILIDLVPELQDAAPALHLLLAVIPLYFFSAFELHLRSAEGRNTPILVLGGTVLGLNVLLNLWLVPAYGLRGAGAALLLTECLQATWILWSGRQASLETRRVSAFLVGSVLYLLALGVAIEHGQVVLAAGAGLVGVVATSPWLRPPAPITEASS